LVVTESRHNKVGDVEKAIIFYFASADKNACSIDVNMSFLKADDVDVVSLCYVPDDA